MLTENLGVILNFREEKLQHDKQRNHISKGYVHPNLRDV